jgi:hypothetical protein
VLADAWLAEIAGMPDLRTWQTGSGANVGKCAPEYGVRRISVN